MSAKEKSKVDLASVAKVSIFVDKDGREVRQFKSALEEPGWILYRGFAAIKVGQRDVTGRTIGVRDVQFSFVFPPSCKGLASCFEMFDELAQAEIDRFMDEQREQAVANKIAIPSLGLKKQQGK